MTINELYEKWASFDASRKGVLLEAAFLAGAKAEQELRYKNNFQRENDELVAKTDD